MQDAGDIPADGLGVLPLLALHIVISVQELEGGGDIILCKTAGLGQALRVGFQPVADGLGGLLHVIQLLHGTLVLGKAPGHFQVERHGAFRLLRLGLRPRGLFGGLAGLLGGTVILRCQVELLVFFIQPGREPALVDVSAQGLEGFLLFLVGQVGQHLQ